MLSETNTLEGLSSLLDRKLSVSQHAISRHASGTGSTAAAPISASLGAGCTALIIDGSTEAAIAVLVITGRTEAAVVLACRGSTDSRRLPW